MYLLTLVLHSLFRWVVLVLGALVVGRAVGGAKHNREWTSADDRAGLWLVITLDAQLLLGLALYLALSPVTRIVFADFGAAMVNAALRFWAVEHIFGMLAAVVLGHVGRFRMRRVDGAQRHRTTALFFGMALLAVLLSIPWPGMPAARPLFRLP
ncbi:MAG: hypothetical protein A3I61_01665 [Acidobacteria bacterium RIFCSPLOWO2_02_FULL_68_18]|nr:MAG: hypothetical protein A3I61_01665 [Acidobacteria bacterium RIFCSPLOWO2_02_FULL_68_18]OFW50186.1 MAG: hypothetical protein A3G77_09445 [Acidobacteria bacterium RIFCSPLOWO2_12_FULL_68_19]